MILVALLIGLAVGLAWEEWHRRRQIRLELQARCPHSWSDVKRVSGTSDFFFQFCTICHLQRHTDKDGKPIVRSR